jgi:HEPN domain-containing protein
MEPRSRERSSVTRLQLVLVRALLDKARDSARDGTDVGLMIALLTADLAVETVIKAAITDRIGEVDRGSRLPQLIAELQKVVPALAARDDIFGMARRLRDARNPVQHAGAHAGRSTVEAFLEDAEKVVAAVVGAVFDVNFETVSVAALVRTPDLREALENAGTATREGRYDDALVLAVGAYESLRIRWGKWIRYALGMDLTNERYGALQISLPAVATFGSEHPHVFDPATEEGSWREITLVALGFSVSDLIRIEGARKCADALMKSKRDADMPAEQRESVTNRAETLAIVEIIARQIWRLEGSQPELFETPPPSMFDNPSA